MLQISTRRCQLCGAPNPKLRYEQEWRGHLYSGFHCAACDLYQTLGSIDTVSPEYQTLGEADLTAAHIHLQTDHKSGAFDQCLGLFERHGPLRGNLLDIGCGIGGFLDAAKAYGLSVFGYDASHVQAAFARKRHPTVGNFVALEDYRETIPADTRFDYITMWDVLEHIREPAPLLRSVRDALSERGLFFVSVPGGGPIGLKIAFGKMTRKPADLCPWEHVFYYTPKSLRLLFEQNGFEVLEIGGVTTYPRPWGVREVIRRVSTALLRRTKYALQLYAVVRPIRPTSPPQSDSPPE